MSAALLSGQCDCIIFKDRVTNIFKASVSAAFFSGQCSAALF